MKTIYKYPLEIVDVQTVKTNKSYKVVLVGNQEGQLCLWLQVDTEKPTIDLQIVIKGTGHEIPKNPPLTHLGSAIVGAFVWHVYRPTESSDIKVFELS